MMMLPLLASLIMLHLIPAKYFLLKTEDKTEERQVNAVISSGGGGDDGNTVSPNTDGRAPARWSTSTSKMKNHHGRAPAGPMRNVCKRFPGLHLAKGTCIHTVFAVLVYLCILR